jgi:hypothetical protein
MNAVMSKFIPAVYDLYVEFALTGDQDLDDPVDFLPRNLSRLMTGHRDFHFAGTEQEMKNIMRQFCSSPFKVIRFSVYPNGDHFHDFNDRVLEAQTARAQRRAKAK